MSKSNDSNIAVSRRALLAGAGAGAAAIMLAQNEAQAQAQTQSDRPIIFTHTTVATPDLTQDDVALAVVGGTIAAIGPNDAVMRQYPNADIYDGRGKAILPGLVNCHAHLRDTVARGFNEDFGFPNSAKLAVRPESLLQGDEKYLMATVGARADNSLLHGFSRGAANLYGIVALDAGTPRPLFRQVIANAGGMSPDFPMNRDVEHGHFGRTPYAGTRWWLYCGAGDHNPERDGCPAMRRSQAWLKEKGATAELAEDPGGDHGGFHRRGQNVERALDWLLGGR